jgi:hypothetical protein
MFFPRQGPRRRRLTVKRLEGERVRAVLEDLTERTYALDRLLATDDQGNGLYYRFHGWKPQPRGYHTELRVARISPSSGRCAFVLPEWDPTTEIDEAVDALPEALRAPDAVGSCMANLASATVAGLSIHGYRLTRPRGISREVRTAHPVVLAERQRYRRRHDGLDFVLVNVEGPRVRAWNGERIVRVASERLLAVDEDGIGRFYEYRGGGVWAARRNSA